MTRVTRRTSQRAAPAAKASSPDATTPPVEPALEHLSFALGRAYYNYLGMLEQILAETGLDEHLRPGMGPVLFALFEHDDRTIKELVQRLGLSYSRLSGMLSRMARAGVVECRRDPDDGRSVRARLTPMGKSLEGRCLGVLRRIDQVMQSAVSGRDARILQQGLQRLTATMRGYEGRRRGKNNT